MANERIIIVERGVQGQRGLTGVAAPESITVAQNIEAVITTANNMGDINTVVDNLSAILDAPNQAADAAMSAVEAQAAVGGVRVSPQDPFASHLQNKIQADFPLEARKVTKKLHKFVENNVNGQHTNRQDSTAIAPNVPIIASFRVDATSERQIVARIRDAGATTNFIDAIFRPSLGTVSTPNNNGNAVGGVATMTPIGGGEYLCTLSGTPNNAGSSVRLDFGLFNGTSTSYLGDNASGEFIRDVQLELGTIASPYQKTTSVYGSINKLLYSEDFTNAVWVKSNLTITANAKDSPAGETYELSVPAANRVIDAFVGTGSLANYTLSQSPGSGNNVDIFASGVQQAIGQYTVTGNTLSINLPSGVPFEARYVGNVLPVGEPGAGTVNMSKLAADVLAALLVAPGIMVMWPSASAIPTGWLKCDGSAVSRTTYANLFAAIGIAHGQGNGTTTFNLPDMQGYVPRGVDGSAGRDPDKAGRTAPATGGNTGNNPGSVQQDALQNLTGSFGGTCNNVAATGVFSNGASYSGNGQNAQTNYYVGFNASAVARTSTETRMKNVNTHFIIKI